MLRSLSAEAVLQHILSSVYFTRYRWALSFESTSICRLRITVRREYTLLDLTARRGGCTVPVSISNQQWGWRVFPVGACMQSTHIQHIHLYLCPDTQTADTQSTHMNTENPQEICFFTLSFQGSLLSWLFLHWQTTALVTVTPTQCLCSTWKATKISVPQGKAPL